ncbi:MAG: hypothetical protein R2849_22880 [Thermomicrobiales bacterium]
MTAGRSLDRAWTIIERTAERLGVDLPLAREDLICRDGHVGPGYAIPTDECIAARLARMEAIFIEPTTRPKHSPGCSPRSERPCQWKDIIFLHRRNAGALFARQSAGACDRLMAAVQPKPLAPASTKVWFT